MQDSLTVLIVEATGEGRTALLGELRKDFATVEPTEIATTDDFASALPAGPFEVIITDNDPPHIDGLAIVQRAKACWPDCTVILYTATATEQTIGDAVQAGLDAYLPRVPSSEVWLRYLVRSNLESSSLRRQQRTAEHTALEHLQLAKLIAEVSLSVTQDQPLNQLLRRCADPIVRRLGAAFARIWTLNLKLNVLELQAGSGAHTDFDLRFSRVPLEQSSIGGIARSRQPLLTNSLQDDPHFCDQEWVRAEGLVAFAGHPLAVAERLVGVLAVFSQRPLTPFALTILSAVADQIALGIERKRAEEAMQLSEQRYRCLIETAPDVIATISPEGLLSGANSTFESIFGWPSAEWIGRPFHGLFFPEDLSRALRVFSQVLCGEIPDMLEARCVTRSGARIDVEVLTTPQISDGRVVGALAVVRDVTARKRLESQFLQAQKMEAVGRLAGGVAHDFNNLLTVINGYSDMLARLVSTQEQARSLVEEVCKAGERAAGLTQRLLAFSRKQVMIPRLLDLNGVVTDLEKMLHRLIGEDVQLHTGLARNLRPIKADPTHIESIIVNLAVNARDAMPEGGQLLIETANRDLDAAALVSNPLARPGPFVLLSVTDTGCGIAPHVLPQIFEPFFTTKGPGKGTGLGLATVHDIVRQSGGIIQVYSEVAKGSTFRIYFPQPEDTPAFVPSRPSLEVRLRGTETILLVEDDEGVRALARLVLQTRGYTALEARHGEEAVRIASQFDRPIHLVVSDLVMPGLSARALLNKIQEDRPTVRFLFMSGYLDDAIAQHGLIELGLPFLQKPFTPDSLTAKVREVLDGT